MSGLTLGSLFDGIGTFPLSGLQYGFTPVWASEIEPFPIRVTQTHFPDMKHLGDINEVNGAEIELVDVITFGSPCQDLSAAGKREGLSGERSGLFMQAVRIIREMRTATGGKYPRFAVWENVPGAFSSNKGEDFRAVLEEITASEIPMPDSGKWATAGMVRTERVDIAWRTPDAQYWGVPQRRKRIFLVADFGGQCAGEILFIEEGLRGDTAESGKAREEAAGDAGDGTKATSYAFYDRNSANARSIGLGLKTENSCGIAISQPSRINCTPEGITGAVSSKWAKGAGGPAGDEHYNLLVIPIENHPQDSRVKICEDGTVQTLSSKMGTGGGNVPMIMEPQVIAFQPGNLSRRAGAEPSEDTFPTLGATTQGGQFPHVATFQNTGQGWWNESDIAATVRTPCGGDSTKANLVGVGYAVRRLTPLECERLQGLPDGWTDIPPQTEVTEDDIASWRPIWDKWDDINGKKHHSDNQIKSWLRSEVADTVRYKAIGNGIAKPCSDFVLGRIVRVLKAGR